MYSSLLQSQCLGDSFYYNENHYQNLSLFGNSTDLASNINNPVGIYSSGTSANQAYSSMTGRVGGTSINQVINQVKSRKSIFKYRYDAKIANCENDSPFSISPLLNIDSNEQAT